MKKDFYLGFYNWILNKFYQRDTLGLKMPQTAESKAACSKCGFKHNRPVGIRCKRALNSSAPTLRDANNSDEEGVAERSQQLNTEAVPGQAVASGDSMASSSNQVDSKLDLILKKVQDIEAKNQQLEQQLHRQRSKVSSKPHFSHSSPKRTRSSAHRSSRGSRKGHTVNYDSSDASTAGELEDTWQSSVHTTQITEDEGSEITPSLQFLKQDARTQRKVQRQLEKLQGQSRSTTVSGKPFKSGLHRSGDNAVRLEIPWPHHHCFPGPGGNLPDYKDLSPLQFMVGFLGCIQEEASNTVRSNMLEYGRHLFQDAIETNWSTARHAHLVLLQDIERGKCSWRRPDVVEKIRIRNTARVIAPKPSANAAKGAKSSSREKICQDFNSNTCKHPSDHIVNGEIVKHACSYCYKEVNKLCYHKLQDCLRRKATDNSKDKAQPN